MKCAHILFAHAFLGCGTTSALYGLGKPQAIKMLENEGFVCVANAFQSQTATRDEITVASVKGFLLSYKTNKLTEPLNELRNIKFNQRIAGKVRVVFPHELPPTFALFPQELPPTFAAAKYHGWKVHLQVMKWSGVTGFNPEKWGWALKENKPLSTDRPPSPSYLQWNISLQL